VYPSVDVNVATDRMNSCDPAYRGLRDVLAGKLSIRCYGEFDLIKHLHDAGLTDGPGWLAGATSWSAGDHSESALVCMVQHVGSDIPSTDRNTVTQPLALGAWWPPGHQLDADSARLLEEEFTVDAEAKKYLDTQFAVIRDRLTALFAVDSNSDGARDFTGTVQQAAQAALNTAGVAPSAKAAAASSAASVALVTELGLRVAKLQSANDAQSQQIAALVQQVADLASGKVNVTGSIPATLTIGA